MPFNLPYQLVICKAFYGRCTLMPFRSTFIDSAKQNQLRSRTVIQHIFFTHFYKVKIWVSCSNCWLRSWQERKEVTCMKYLQHTDETARFLKQRVRSIVKCVHICSVILCDNVSVGVLQGCNRGGKVHSGWSPFRSTTREKMFSSQGPQALWGKYFWRSCYALVPVSKLPMCLSGPKQDRRLMPVLLTWSTARWASAGLEDCWRTSLFLLSILNYYTQLSSGMSYIPYGKN